MDTKYTEYANLRDKKGVTDNQVSIATGVARSTFTDWKNGRSAPGTVKLKAIADYFNVPMDMFVPTAKV